MSFKTFVIKLLSVAINKVQPNTDDGVYDNSVFYGW